MIAWLAALMALLACSASAQEYNRYGPEPVRLYGVGRGFTEFAVDPGATMNVGPTATGFDRTGRMYVCDSVRGRLVATDISLEVSEEHYGTYSGDLALRFLIGEAGVESVHAGGESTLVDWSFVNRIAVAYEVGRYSGKTVWGSSYYYGDVAFTYLTDSTLISVVKPGLDWKDNLERTLGPAETIALFKEPEKYGLTGLRLGTANRLFVGEEMVSRSYRVFLPYCRSINGGQIVKVGNAVDLTRDPQRVGQTATYHGKDMNGNVYWRAGDTVLIFNRAGQVIEMLYSEGGWGIQSLHPSGDLYSIGRKQDTQFLIHRIRNVWDPKARELWEAYVVSTTGEGIRAARVTAGALRVRRAAGPMGEICGELATGDRVEVLWHGSEKAQIDGLDEYWYEVRRRGDGLQGWVYGGYLRFE